MTSTSARTVKRTLGVLLTVVVLAGLGGAAWAAWSARVTVTAGVSSGTWTTTPTPEPSVSPTPSAPSGPSADGVIAPGDNSEFTTSVVWKNSVNGQLSDPADGNSSTNGNQTQCAVVTVRTTISASERAAWTIIADYSKAPYSGTRPNLTSSGNVTDVDATHLRITGWNSQEPGGTTTTVKLCDSTVRQAADFGENSYSVSTSNPVNATVNNQNAYCSTVTVTGARSVEDYPFYYGWSTEVDVAGIASAYFTRYGSSSLIVHFRNPPSAGTYNYTVNGAQGDSLVYDSAASTYTVASSSASALQGHGTYSFDACVTRY